MAYANSNLPRFLPAAAALLLLLAAAGCREEAEPRAAVPPAPPNPRWTLAGRVSVPRGVDSSGVLVFAEGTSHLAATDQDGKWQIGDVPPGKYKVRARREDLKPVDIAAVTLDPKGEGSTAPGNRIDLPSVDLESLPAPSGERAATRTGSVRGVIRLLDGSDDFTGVVVQVGGTELRTVTNTVGEYYFPALGPGDIRLIFARKDLQTAEASTTVIPGREMPGPIVEMRPTESAQSARRVLRGQMNMTDAQGATVAKFNRVIVSLEGTTHVAVPDSQGRFIFTDLPAGTYAVMATAPGFELKDKIDVDLTSLEAAEVTVSLVESEEATKNLGTVAGRVTFEDPPESGDNSGILVSLVGANLVAVTDLDGNYQIANVPPNAYLFRAQAEGHVPEFIDNVVVKPGETTQLDALTLLRYIAPPIVLYTDPGDGATGVAIVRDTPLSIRFSKRMRPETVKAAFSIDPPVAARLFMGKESPQSDFDLLYVELLGTPGLENATPLRFDTTYLVTISDAATDFEDARLENPYSFEFTTGEPMIISSRPANGDQYAFVSHREPLVIEFNAQMDHSKFAPDDIRLRPDPVGQPTLQAYDDPVSGWTVVRYYMQLELDKEYTASFRGNWRTVDGAKVGNMPFRLAFKTAQFYEYKPYLGTKE